MSARKKTPLFFLLMLSFYCFGPPELKAQVLTYALSTSSVAYSSISTGTVVSELFAGTDDEISGLYNIGFTFFYGVGCVPYTQFKVSANGWLTFNTAAATGDPINDLSGNTTMRPGLAPLWDDLALNWAGTPVWALVSGSSPNQVLTVQWSQASWKIAGANPGQMSFQIKLYESSNVIDFIYHQETGALTAGCSASIGLADVATGSGNYYSMNAALTSASKTVNTTTIASKPTEGNVFTWTPDCSAMPIELLFFKGKHTAEGNILDWTTATETFNDYFTVERSYDGINFREIQKVKGAGNSLVTKSYRATDPDAGNEIVYYRLKQTDLNGAYILYRAIQIGHDQGLPKVNPNPSEGVFYVESNTPPESIVHYRVIDMLGKIVYERSAQSDLKIDLQEQSTGIYFLTMEQEDTHVFYREKIVKY